MSYAKTSEPNIIFSQRAAARVALLAKKKGQADLMLRLRVDGGGCSGFQYHFDFAQEIQSEDIFVETDGVKLVIDNMSLPLLEGSEVDYVTTLAGAAFAVKNPNAASSCGCGTSFSIG